MYLEQEYEPGEYEESRNYIDSAVLDKHGKFKFRCATTHPDYYVIYSGAGRIYLPIIAAAGDQLVLKIDYAKLDEMVPYEISGSEESAKMMELHKILKEGRRKLRVAWRWEGFGGHSNTSICP